MNYMLEKIHDEIRRSKDNIIWEALDSHGYSKEWCLNPDNTHRITIDSFCCNGEILERLVIRVDNIPLFSVTTTMTIDMEKGTANFGFSVEDFTANK